jgi:hypothetical protein
MHMRNLYTYIYAHAQVGIFLFKELGYISGIIVVFAVLLLLFFIILVLSPLILIVFLVFMSSKGTVFVLSSQCVYSVAACLNNTRSQALPHTIIM